MKRFRGLTPCSHAGHAIGWHCESIAGGAAAAGARVSCVQCAQLEVSPSAARTSGGTGGGREGEGLDGRRGRGHEGAERRRGPRARACRQALSTGHGRAGAVLVGVASPASNATPRGSHGTERRRRRRGAVMRVHSGAAMCKLKQLYVTGSGPQGYCMKASAMARLHSSASASLDGDCTVWMKTRPAPSGAATLVKKDTSASAAFDVQRRWTSTWTWKTSPAPPGSRVEYGSRARLAPTTPGALRACATMRSPAACAVGKGGDSTTTVLTFAFLQGGVAARNARQRTVCYFVSLGHLCAPKRACCRDVPPLRFL